MQEMKDSGIEWIGKIPKGWEVTKLKYEVSEPLKYGASESGVDFDDNLPRYIRITDIDADGNLKEDGKLSLTENQAKGYLLKDNSVLFARSGGTVGKTFFYHSYYGKSAFAGYLISAVPDSKKMYANWLYLYTKSNAYWDWANRVFTQATIQNIGADKYEEMYIPLPPLPEQHRIADFLDAKCAELDVLFSDIKKQIDILEQYKRSVITEAVTKGLDKNVQMKDSGIEWIGKIPEEWEVTRIKYTCTSRTEKAFFYHEIDNYLGLENVEGFSDKIIKTDTIYTDGYYDTYKKDDVLFNKLRPYLGKVIVANQNGFCTGEFMRLFNYKGDNRFLRYWMINQQFINEINSSTYGAKMPRANPEFVLNMPIPILSVDEQHRISDYLDKKCALIDSIITAKQAQLSTLEKYKKSLIYEYVTGKKVV